MCLSALNNKVPSQSDWHIKTELSKEMSSYLPIAYLFVLYNTKKKKRCKNFFNRN